MEGYEILWKSALVELEKTISTVFYRTYIVQLKAIDLIGHKLILCTPSELFANTITNNQGERIRNALIAVNNEVSDFEIVVADSKDEYLKKIGEETRERLNTSNSLLNPKFTFESYVTGDSNQFAFAAAKAVAEHPGESYNPLYVYGGTGLGKTHMLMAIANHLRITKPSLNVLYTTCEQFTNEMIEKVRTGKAAEFHKRYRSVDVLIIDDIQFISGKDGSQTEFFNTFNELTLQNKQIVIASDRAPKDIEGLQDRLRTRFDGGLVADVTKPDLETKVAILKKKAEEQKTIVDIKVLTYLVEKNEDDIRSLMGKLTKVIFASKLHEQPITINLVNEALKESIGDSSEGIKAEDVISCVCEYYKITKTDMLSKKKNKEFSEPRQVCMYLIIDMINSLPLATIGEKMGGRDHSTVIYARDKIAKEMKMLPSLATQVNDIKKMILKQ